MVNNLVRLTVTTGIYKFGQRKGFSIYVALIQDPSKTMLCIWVTTLLLRLTTLLPSQRLIFLHRSITLLFSQRLYFFTQVYKVVALTATIFLHRSTMLLLSQRLYFYIGLRWCCSHRDMACDISEQAMDWWVIVPTGYNMKHVPHPGIRKWSGVPLLYKSAILVRVLEFTITHYANFEHVDYDLDTNEIMVRLALMNQTPSSKQNQWFTFLVHLENDHYALCQCILSTTTCTWINSVIYCTLGSAGIPVTSSLTSSSLIRDSETTLGMSHMTISLWL